MSGKRASSEIDRERKREILESVRLLLKRGLPEAGTWHPSAAEELGLTRLNVVIENGETGEELRRFETYRAPEDYGALFESVTDAIEWPPELLKAIGFELISGAWDDPVVSANLLGVIKKQLLGGRPPNKQIDYEGIAQRILAEGTYKTFEREYEAWYREWITDDPECPPRLDPDAKEIFYRAMYRYGVRKRELK